MCKNGDNPAFVTFVPVAGLQSYTPHEDGQKIVVYRRLEKNLRKTVDVVRKGGFILLRKPFEIDWLDIEDFFKGVPQGEYISSIISSFRMI